MKILMCPIYPIYTNKDICKRCLSEDDSGKMFRRIMLNSCGKSNWTVAFICPGAVETDSEDTTNVIVDDSPIVNKEKPKMSIVNVLEHRLNRNGAKVPRAYGMHGNAVANESAEKPSSRKLSDSIFEPSEPTSFSPETCGYFFGWEKCCGGQKINCIKGKKIVVTACGSCDMRKK